MDEIEPVEHEEELVQSSDKPTTVVLDKDDYCFVISKEGLVKKCFMPTSVKEDEEVPKLIVDIVEAMEEAGEELDNENDSLPIHDLDLTKQTVTLGTSDNPLVSLMRGHVDELTYVKGFHEEGWNNDGTEITEEEWKEMAECEKGMLEHTYGLFNPEGKGTWQWRVDKNVEGAEPVTIRFW